MIRFAGFRAAKPRFPVAAAFTVALSTLLLTGHAAAATNATTTSSNWSGYAAHGSGARFDSASGRWRVPTATCVEGERTFSSFWVGIGGYSRSSDGLEQDGIEVDCKTDGQESVSAWYELLPSGPHTVSLAVQSGDLVSASVSLQGNAVTLEITDLTTDRTFSRTVHDTHVDNTSAEWIAEAPEDCTGSSDCQVLPLADFRTVHLDAASATTTTGVTSGIASRLWTTTKLLLGYEKQNGAFIARTGGTTATPSSLRNGARAFTVSWKGAQSDTTTGTSGIGQAPNPGGAGGVPDGSGGSGGPSGGGPGSF
jgi:hypothetical protein